VGIQANNSYRADFLYDNLMIQNNIIHASFVNKVKKLLFLGSSCIYPKLAPQPLKEDYLLSGYLEDTNEPYAIAKIAGIKLCESYFRQHGRNSLA
jgi:GDP-L-fucose synthase